MTNNELLLVIWAPLLRRDHIRIGSHGAGRIFHRLENLTGHLVRGGGGSVAEWLERWTCNPEAPSSSSALTAYWICSLQSRVQIRDHACK